MTFLTFARRSLLYHARAHLGVVLGAAIGSAALTGALIVGDSMRGSLRERALEGLGSVTAALAPADRFVTEGLAARLGEFPRTEAILKLPAIASRPDGAARANGVSLLGVPGSFGNLGFAGYGKDWNIPPDEVWLNEALAARLRVERGDTLVLRFAKPSALSLDAAVSPRSGQAATLRLRVGDVRGRNDLGDFRLQPGQEPPLNAFVSLARLQQAADLAGRVNLLLSTNRSGGTRGDDETATRKQVLEAELKKELRLADLEASLVALTNGGGVELRSRRVFLDPALARAAHLADTNATPIVTYLANLLFCGTNSTPYSMVTAAGPPYTPAGMGDDEIMISQWLAEDLGAKRGDNIALVYFEPESGAALRERTNTFRVRDIVLMQSPWSDASLMPDFPGIRDAETAGAWDAGFPLVHKIRAKDEDYWRTFRGTPKAFVTLAAGQQLWANRFGNVTSIRFSAGGANGSPESAVARLETRLLAEVQPADFGLAFEPVRARALESATQGQDFGQLFLGFSFFLVVASLLLVALLFQLGLERRAAEVGTLLALGFAPGRLRRWLMIEGGALAIAGGLIGTIAGVYYAWAMLRGLATAWRGAVGGFAPGIHITGETLMTGLCAGAIVAWLVLWLVCRNQARQPIPELLAGEIERADTFRRAKAGATHVANRNRAVWFAVLCGLAAIGLIGWRWAIGDQNNAGAFFGAGALLLVAGLGICSAWLETLGRRKSVRGLTLGGVGVRGCARRRKRSLGIIATIACGAFVIIAVGAFRLDAGRDAFRRSSGTGGFALIGQSTLPIPQDLGMAAGRETLGLSPEELRDVHIVACRLHEGEDASCLNLNRARQPRILGVRPELLAGRFTFSGVIRGKPGEGWELLRTGAGEQGGGETSAIGDAASIQWAMGKKIGDTLAMKDDRGRVFNLRLAGGVAGTILQGSLVIDEAEFLRRFPGDSGYRFFLVDAPSNAVTRVSSALSRALGDAGLELVSATERLNSLNAVQNTYLGAFQVLGGLGLLLGSAGLGVVVMRNVLERRGELAVMSAVGFRARTLERLILIEHAALLLCGLCLGGVAAVVAVLPSVVTPGAALPWRSLGLMLGVVLLNGVLWSWGSARVALKGNPLDALRNQ